jgi:hypothetical protein
MRREWGPESIPTDTPVEIARSEIAAGAPVTVAGSKTGHPEVLVLLQADRLVASRSFNSLRKFIIDQDITLQLNPWSVCQFLRNSYVPLPYTIFDDIYFLGFGDRLIIEAGPDLTRTVKLEYEFPFVASTSRGDSPTSVERFRREMAAAVERGAGRFTERVLMLSSGPDSAAVALGVADNGFQDVHCLTYGAGSEAGEGAAAAVLARRLGLRHETIALPDDPARVADFVRAFLRRCFLPSGDPALMPYGMCLHEAGVGKGVCLDGLGEVLYGRAEKCADRLKLRLNVSAWLGAATALVPHYSRLVWFFRPQINIYVRDYNLEPVQIARIYEPAVDVERFWVATDKALTDYDVIDHIVALRCRQYEHGRNVHKIYVATSAMNLTAGLPWRDRQFGEYFFNLPEIYRYDRQRNTSKDFCRAVLRESTGLDSFVTRSFPFDLARFCEQHRDLIWTEIIGCRLWTQEVEQLLRRLYKALRRHRFASVSINDIFQLSAWLNHSPLPIRQ